MATKNPEPASHRVANGASSLDALKEQNVHLQGELETERKLNKQLRREKSYNVQQMRDLEQAKTKVALNDLQTKLHLERVKDQEMLKDSLNRKFDLDLQKVIRQKDMELNKLRVDLRKCQNELEETREQPNKCGLSNTSARTAFDRERQKLLKDTQELRITKRHLETELKSITEADKQKSLELLKVREETKMAVTKARKEADIEVKRLLEELKGMDRLTWQKEKEKTSNSAATKLLSEVPSISMATTECINGATDCASSGDKTDASLAEDVTSEARNTSTKETTGAQQQKVKELTKKNKELVEMNTSQAQDKVQLQQKIKDSEKKHRVSLDKNKRFLEKNIELTGINRNLEEKIKKLSDELNKLRSQTEKSKKEQHKLNEQLSTEKVDKTTLIQLKDELEELKQLGEEQEKTVTALKMACIEKDRRIELLIHKRRKQKNNKAQQKVVRFILPAKVHCVASGLRETYYGYDDDTESMSSEMSSASYLSSSRLSLDTSNDDDDVFEQFTRDDLEQSFQHLMKEHLELEKSYALLQTKVGHSHTDPQRENKDTGWLEEKDTLNKTIRMLKDKVKSQDCHQTRLTERISEIQEQNEELEFRVLELDEINEKLKEDAVDTITITEPPNLTDDGVLEMFAVERGHMEIKMETLKDKLHDLKYAKDGQLDKGDKLVLLQARAMLGIADKKLKDLVSTQDQLKERIKKLEAEKAELLSAATGVSTDLILEHEETRQKLEEAETKIQELEESAAKYKETEAVYKYTEEHNQRSEDRYKHEISSLQRQISNSQVGHQYESELWQENIDKIKNYEQKIQELQGQLESERERIEVSEAENSHLQCGLTQLQCESSQLQLENTQLQDTKIQLHDKNKHLQKQLDKLKGQLHAERDDLVNNLGGKIDEYEQIVLELSSKSNTLGSEIEAYQIKLKASQLNENTLKTKHSELQKQFKESTDKSAHHENEVKNLQDELAKQQSHLESKAEGVLKLRIRIGELSKQVNSLTEEKQSADEKVTQLTADNDDLRLKVVTLDDLRLKVATLTDLEQQVSTLSGYESTSKQLQEKLNTLQALATEQTTKATNLEVKVQDLESTNQKLTGCNADLQKLLDKSQKDAGNQIAQLNAQSKSLIEKVRSLEAKLLETRENEVQVKDHLCLMEEEKSRRILDLQAQVDQLEENEAHLSQTIMDMERIEQELRDQVAQFDVQTNTLSTSWGEVTTQDVEHLRQSEHSLKVKVKELEDHQKSLSDKISELELRIDELDKDASDKAMTIGNYQQNVREMEDKICELTAGEEKLLQELYAVKLENQELQEHVDDLINKDDDVRVTEADDLRTKIQELEQQASGLKDELLKAKLAAVETDSAEIEDKNMIQALQDHINDLEALSVEQDKRITDLQESEDNILKDCQKKQDQLKYMEEKVNTLIQGEDKMIEKIEFLEENRVKLNEEIGKLHESSLGAGANSSEEVLHNKILLLESRETELLDKSLELEQMNKSLKDRINQSQTSQSGELCHLQEKVEILIEAEEKLVDRLHEQEEVEEELRTEVQKHADKRTYYEDKCQELQHELNSLRRDLDHSGKLEETKARRIKDLEDNERVLRVRINELEKSELMLRMKLTGAEDAIKQKELQEKQLKDEVEAARETQSESRDKVAELEKNDIALRTKLTGLEAQKQDLLETIQMSTQRSRNQNNHDDFIKPAASSHNKSQPTNKGASQKSDNNSTSLSTEIDALQQMPKEEMISRIHELEQMEQFHIEKIKELSDNLSTFRQAVEVVAVTMETDSDIPLLNYKPKLRDQEFEAQVQELVKSEVTLKLRNLQLEKKQAILKTQLHEAELMLKQQTREYHAEIEDLEAELDHTRKNEAKLKNKLQYGGWGSDSQSLAKIQHLEDLVFELESSERKLKRQRQEAEDSEQELRQKLFSLDQGSNSQPLLSFKSLEDEDKFYELLAQVTRHDDSEKQLKAALAQMNDESSPNLKNKIEQLEKYEMSLKRKLDQMEVQEENHKFDVNQSMIMLDSPEAILRQRIQELERMERYLKQQVVDLERDHEELHEIARKDKAVIHQLNVLLCELRLSEKNLKDHVNKMEVTENNLQMKIDGMSDRIEDLEDVVKKLQCKERHLQALLQKSEYKESTLAAQLEHTKEDLHKAENKYKRKVNEIDMEKEQFVQKIDELTERVGDLDGVEMSLKQKVRNMENCELTMKDKITELERGEKFSKTRIEELENVNETQSSKTHKLEEEKASLVYEISNQEVIHSERSRDAGQLNLKIKTLSSTVKEHERKKENLQKRFDDLNERNISLLNQLQGYEKDTKILRDRLTASEQQNKELRDGKSNACGHNKEITELKKEVSQLSTVLQAFDMLRENHKETKKQLTEVEGQLRNCGVNVKDKHLMMSKSIQVKLADSYSIRHLEPADLFYYLEEKEEFKVALRNLGARHPEAYQDFVKALHPPESKHPTVVCITGTTDSPTAPRSSNKSQSSTTHHRSSKPGREKSGINEDFVIAKQQDDKMAAVGTVCAQGGPRKAPANQHPQQLDAPVRRQLIGQLIEAMPLADVPENTTEDPLWQVVEDHDDEKPFWAEVESGPVDDMTLTVDVWGMTTDESSSEASNPVMLRSASSLDSDVPVPPLPGTMPPAAHPGSPSNDSYYLPSNHDDCDDSADEASEIIDEDDGAMPLRNATRAKSADRDSDFSEASFLQTVRRRKGNDLRLVAGSLESIPDSGTGSLRQDEILKVMKNRIKELEHKLKISQDNSDSLKNKDILLLGSTDLKGDNNDLKQTLDQRQKDLTAKTKEIERLREELRHWQTGTTSAQDEKYSAERSLKKAEQQLEILRNVEKSYTQLQLDYDELKSEHETLKCQMLEKSGRDIAEMETVISDLKAKLTDHTRVTLEVQCLEKKIKALEDEVRCKVRSESKMTQQNVNMSHELNILAQQQEYYSVMENDYKNIRSKFEEMVKIKSKALTMVTPLRAKLLRFAGKCKTKDNLIQRLVSDLQHSGEQSELIMEANRMITLSASEDYNRPISPITVQNIHLSEKELRASDIGLLPPVTLPQKPSKIPRRTRNQSGGSAASDCSTGSDVDDVLNGDVINGCPIIIQPHRGDLFLRGGRTPTIDDYAVSPPHLSRQPITHLNNNYVDGSPRKSDKLSGAIPETDMYIAIKAYDPEQFSHSGHQDLELPLREGDLVKVTGAVNNQGYYKGEMNGRVGLVPALYLQPHKGGVTPAHKHRHPQVTSSQANSSPEQILSLHKQLQQSHTSNFSVSPSHQPSGGTLSPRSNGPAPLSPRSNGPAVLIHPAFVRSTSVPSVQPLSPRSVAHPAYHPGSQTQQTDSSMHHHGNQTQQTGCSIHCPPEPPTNFCVQRVVGDHSILLSWSPPGMDELARSNSTTVTGYKIYVNHNDKQTISSPHMTKALVEKLQLHRGPLTFSIQTIAENGQVSRLVDVWYTDDSDWTPADDGHMSTVLSSVSNDDRDRKVFLAIYDYKPSEQSPNKRPSQELSFKAGDVIITYGNVRDDGYYHGKVHGRKGLVPASFIEEIALLRSNGRQRSISSSISLVSSNFSPPGANSSLVSIATPDMSSSPSSHGNQSVTSGSMKGSSHVA